MPHFREEIEIAGRRIGPAHRPYLIAELSGNHNGSLERAIELMESAAGRGADAVKLQTYTADTITIDHDAPEFRIEGGLWDGYTLHSLYDEAHTPWEWHEALFARGRELGVTVFSTPFDPSAVEFLEGLDAPAYKIASFECIDLPLVRRIAETGKPVILSTGMASLGEIADAVQTIADTGCEQLVVLHCVSGYPTPVADTNLRTMVHLSQTFGTVPGLSDHTLGTGVSVAAVALGACVIEKHVTLARADGGPDAAFSLEPDEVERLVSDCRDAFDALGTVDYDRKPSEEGNLVFRRSLYVVEDIAQGDVVTERNVRLIRPGYGLAPKHLPTLLGQRATRRLARGTPVGWSMVERQAN